MTRDVQLVLHLPCCLVISFDHLHLCMYYDKEAGDEEIHQKDGNRVCHQDLLNPLRMWTDREERLQPIVYCLARDEFVGLSVEEKTKSGDLKIRSLLPWPGMASWVPGGA